MLPSWVPDWRFETTPSTWLDPAAKDLPTYHHYKPPGGDETSERASHNHETTKHLRAYTLMITCWTLGYVSRILPEDTAKGRRLRESEIFGRTQTNPGSHEPVFNKFQSAGLAEILYEALSSESHCHLGDFPISDSPKFQTDSERARRESWHSDSFQSPGDLLRFFASKMSTDDLLSFITGEMSIKLPSTFPHATKFALLDNITGAPTFLSGHKRFAFWLDKPDQLPPWLNQIASA